MSRSRRRSQVFSREFRPNNSAHFSRHHNAYSRQGPRNEGFRTQRNYRSAESSGNGAISSRPPPLSTAAGQNRLVNHNWAEEFNGTTTSHSPENYASTGIVLWCRWDSLEVYGEILCERNLVRPTLHFYFDQRTECDGAPLAALALLEDSPLKRGISVEFECTYVDNVVREENVHQMVHISKISVESELTQWSDQVSIATIHNDRDGQLDLGAFDVRLGCDKDFELVLIPGILLYKTFIHGALSQSGLPPMIDIDPEQAEIQKQAFILSTHRTVYGNLCRAPRWLGDVYGQKSNAKRLMLNFSEVPLVKDIATVIKVIPNHYAIMRRRNSSEDMFFPLIRQPAAVRNMFTVYCRVHFVACPEVLESNSHKWRVLTAIPMSRGDAEKYMRSSPLFLSAKPVGECEKVTDILVDEVNLFDIDDRHVLMPTSESECPLISLSDDGISQLHDVDFGITSKASVSNLSTCTAELAEVFNSTHQTSSQASFCKTISSKHDHRNESDDSGIDAGYDPYDRSMVPVRSEIRFPLEDDYEFKFTDEVHCHLVVDPKEQRRRALEKALLLEAKNNADEKKLIARPVIYTNEDSMYRSVPLSALLNTTCLQQSRGEGDQQGSHELNGLNQDYKAMQEIIGASVCSNVSSEIRTIGIYDSLRLVIAQNLLHRQKLETRTIHTVNQGEILQTSPNKNARRSQPWFRRRDPRLLPSVIVTEFIHSRDKAVDELDIHVHSLTETVDVRNDTYSYLRKVARPARSNSIDRLIVDVDTVVEAENDETLELSIEATAVTPSKEAKQKDLIKFEFDDKENFNSSANVINTKPQQVLTQKPTNCKPSLIDSFMKDDVYGTFFASLLKK